MSQNPPWFDELTQGLFTLARERREAREAGVEPPLGGDESFVRALTARWQFLDSLNRLETSPGMSAGEVQQVAAGILGFGTEETDAGRSMRPARVPGVVSLTGGRPCCFRGAAARQRYDHPTGSARLLP